MAYNLDCFKKLQVPKNENYLRLENTVTTSPIFIYAIEPPHNVHTGFELKLHLRGSNNISSSGIGNGPIGLLQHPHNHKIYATDGSISRQEANIIFPKYCPANFNEAYQSVLNASTESILCDFNEVIKEGTEYSPGSPDAIGDWYGGTGIFYGTPYIFVDRYKGMSGQIYYNERPISKFWGDIRNILLYDKIIHLRYIEDYRPLPQNIDVYINNLTGDDVASWAGSTERKGWWIIENITIPCVPNEYKLP